jgi:hypothetical protein
LTRIETGRMAEVQQNIHDSPITRKYQEKLNQQNSVAYASLKNKRKRSHLSISSNNAAAFTNNPDNY